MKMIVIIADIKFSSVLVNNTTTHNRIIRFLIFSRKSLSYTTPTTYAMIIFKSHDFKMI